MKFLVLFACVVAAAHSQSFKPFPSLKSYRAPVYKLAVPVKPVYKTEKYKPVVVPEPVVYARNSYTGDANSNIVKLSNEINPDGSYSYFYETTNGIAAQEQGSPRVYNVGSSQVASNVAQGSYSFTSPEGVPVSISYVADENGYQPTGNVIPTPPPVPPQIARALEYLARVAPRQ